MDKIPILYSTNCPQCKILKFHLDKANVNYIENNDVEEMINKGFKSAPIFEVDGKYLDCRDAIKWINERNKETI
jgi:glutaredoxin